MRRLIALSAFLLLTLSLAAAQPAPDWYLGKIIKDIRFEGTVVVSDKDLDPVVKEFRGKVFTEELWLALLAKMYSLEYFSEISPEALPSDAAYSAVIVLFRLKENPAVNSVVIEGNSGLRSSEIFDALSIKSKTIFNKTRLRLDEIAIRQLYLNKGYPEAMVSSRADVRPDGNIDVVYTVSEGSQNLVDAIRFEGAAAMSASSLKGEMSLKEKALFQSGQFSEVKLEESRQSIELYYKKRGYIDAKVTDVRRDVETTDKGVRKLTLTFVIQEGRKYLYDGMSFEGNSIFPTETLAPLVRQKPGAVLNYERLMQDQTRVADLYFDNGYIYNSFDLAESRDEERGAIAFRILITEREQARIQNVIFRGNVKTLEYVLRREVPIADGDIFSKAKIMEGLRNLYQLQYFSSISPSYEQGTEPPYVNLIINVEEQSTADIQFGMSYVPGGDADSFPLVGLVKWNDKNFMGRGQTLSVGVNVSPDSQDLSLGFREGWLMGQRWSGGVDFSFKHAGLNAAQDSDFDGVPDPYASWEEYLAAGKSIPSENLMSYDTWTFSLGLSTGYLFKLGFADLGLGGGYIIGLTDKTYDAELFNPLESAISSNLNAWLLSNTVYSRVYLNGLDLWYDPSNGYYLSQRLALTGFLPSELSRFVRSDTKAEGYLKLLDWPVFSNWSLKLVLAAHSGFSALLPWFGESAPVASSSEMLRIDGTFVGRGWGQTLGSQYGTSLWENWVELRIPVVPGVLSLDAFFDAAAMANSTGLLDIQAIMDKTGATAAGGWSDLGPGNFAFSAGAGLRFTIPQFPFRLYFSKRFYAGSDGLEFANPDGSWDFVLSITQPLN